MEWINVNTELPEPNTKIIVKTETLCEYTEGNVLRITFHLDKHNKPVWGCKNQIVVQWLKE